MVNVDLLYKALPGGVYRGRIVVHGAPDPDLHVDPGTCEDLRIANRLRQSDEVGR
jgi:hypothetical protein